MSGTNAHVILEQAPVTDGLNTGEDGDRVIREDADPPDP